jgi:dolichol-phosphate mannosyltransferase
MVVPTFNESENIGAFLFALRQNLEPVLTGRYEIIVVDDDSPDRTWQVAAQALPGFANLRVVRRQHERGLATGVMRGYQLARGEWLGTINADFQHPPDMLPKMLELAPGADVVVASRYADGGGLGDWAIRRRISSRGACLLGRLLLPGVFRRSSDPLSGCYIFRRAAAAGVEFRPLGYKSLMEIMALGSVQTVRECAYEMSERRLGRSKVAARHWYEYLQHLLRLRALTKTGETRGQ